MTNKFTGSSVTIRSINKGYPRESTTFYLFKNSLLHPLSMIQSLKLIELTIDINMGFLSKFSYEVLVQPFDSKNPGSLLSQQSFAQMTCLHA